MLTRRTFTILLGSGLATLSRGAQADTTGRQEFEIMKSDEQWKKELTPEQYAVLRQHGTERAGTSPLDKTYAPGEYRCAACGQPLFSSETKYDSGSGWPSFWAPLDDAVGTSTDFKLIYPRTEVHCARCGGHLGHVFEDGPKPTGERYCMNGVALEFVPEKKD